MIKPALQDDAFVSAVRDADSNEDFFLWWVGQSGFLVKWQGKQLPASSFRFREHALPIAEPFPICRLQMNRLEVRSCRNATPFESFDQAVTNRPGTAVRDF